MSQTTPPTPSQPPQQSLPSSARPSDSLSHARNPPANQSLFDPLPPDASSTTQSASSARPSALTSHRSSESRNTRAITSADRSTVHSPTGKGAPWHPSGALNVKNEDDDASLSGPGLSPTSPIAAPVHHAQALHHYGHPSHHEPNQYPYVPESVQFYPQAAAPPPQGPPGAPLSPPQGVYPTQQQPPHYGYHPHPPPIIARNAPQHQYHYARQQSQPQQPSSPHSPGDPRCDCRDCSSSTVMGSQPYSGPGMEFASRPALPYSWSAAHNPSMGPETLAGGGWMEPQFHRHREASPSDRWQEPPGMIGPHSRPLHSQQVSVPGGPPQGYPGESPAYPADVPRWPNSQFDYTTPPPHMYPSSYPPSGPGPSSASMSPTGSSVSWAIAQDPSSPDAPPSPSDSRSDKPVKHKSRKTWTEVEWKKLTDLAERSKRGDPGADIDWDYVTNGFGGRRCRQGILTVAAKRGLKVSTREARTIGKRARSAEEGD